MPAKKSTAKPAAATSVKPARATKPAKSPARDKAPKLAALALGFGSPDEHAYPTLVQALLARLPLQLTDDERAYYEGSIDEAEALSVGTRYESSGVLDDLLQIVNVALPHVVAGKVPGYGGLRLRYHVELGEALAEEVDRLDTSLVEAVGATAATTTSLRGTRALRRAALRALQTLAGRRAEESERLSRARRGSEKPDERARALEVIAQELESIVARVPARVAADAGATPELMAKLRENARAVLSTRGEAQESRGVVRSIYDEMNLLDGRIIHEIRFLVGAMRDARIGDKTIPTVRSQILRRASRKKAAQPAPSAPVTFG